MGVHPESVFEVSVSSDGEFLASAGGWLQCRDKHLELVVTNLQGAKFGGGGGATEMGGHDGFKSRVSRFDKLNKALAMPWRSFFTSQVAQNRKVQRACFPSGNSPQVPGGGSARIWPAGGKA